MFVCNCPINNVDKNDNGYVVLRTLAVEGQYIRKTKADPQQKTSSYRKLTKILGLLLMAPPTQSNQRYLN